MPETELKFRLPPGSGHAGLRARLEALRARPLARHREENQLYDDARGRLRRRGSVLRLRRLDGGPGAVLTYKGPSRFDGAIKVREEHETALDDADAMAAVLGGLGYRPAVYYAKTREEWRIGEVVVALDELDFGLFCELEGPADEIVAVARALGLRRRQATRLGYPTMAARHAAAVGRNADPPSSSSAP